MIFGKDSSLLFWEGHHFCESSSPFRRDLTIYLVFLGLSEANVYMGMLSILFIIIKYYSRLEVVGGHFRFFFFNEEIGDFP